MRRSREVNEEGARDKVAPLFLSFSVRLNWRALLAIRTRREFFSLNNSPLRRYKRTFQEHAAEERERNPSPRRSFYMYIFA